MERPLKWSAFEMERLPVVAKGARRLLDGNGWCDRCRRPWPAVAPARTAGPDVCRLGPVSWFGLGTLAAPSYLEGTPSLRAQTFNGYERSRPRAAGQRWKESRDGQTEV